jgi:hypothetical protein
LWLEIVNTFDTVFTFFWDEYTVKPKFNVCHFQWLKLNNLSGKLPSLKIWFLVLFPKETLDGDLTVNEVFPVVVLYGTEGTGSYLCFPVLLIAITLEIISSWNCIMLQTALQCCFTSNQNLKLDELCWT